jgi:hypothetical protein
MSELPKIEKPLPVPEVMEDYIPLAGRHPCKYDFVELKPTTELVPVERDDGVVK